MRSRHHHRSGALPAGFSAFPPSTRVYETHTHTHTHIHMYKRMRMYILNIMCTLKHNTYTADELFSWSSSDRPCAFDICLPAVPYIRINYTPQRVVCVCVRVCVTCLPQHTMYTRNGHTMASVPEVFRR